MESGIRWESQSACNNSKADGSGPEQMEESSPPMLALNLLYLLQIYSFTSALLTWGPVYKLGWYGICFIMEFHSGKKPSQRSTNACKVL